MKNIKLYILIICGAILFVSCNEDDDKLYNNFDGIKKTTGIIYSTKDIANRLATALIEKPSLAEDIHKGIDTIVNFGLDENLTMFDIKKTDKSVFFSNPNQFSSLQDVFSNDFLEACGYTEDNFYNDLNIYWGYHDEWDHKTPPIIAYVDQDVSPDRINGYLIKGNSIQNIAISSAFFDSVIAPVIIINFNETSYSEYPEFKIGKRTKNGTTFLKGTPILKDDEPAQEYGIYDNPNKIYEAVFRALQSANGAQYDYWYAGGSEIYVKSGAIDANGNPKYNNHRCELTRKEIKNRTTIYYEYPILFDDWKVEYLNMPTSIYEQDPGTETTIAASISIKNIGSVSVNIPLKNNDDLIGSVDRSRASYMADHANGDNWKQYGSMKISMGLKIKDRVH